MAVCGVIAEYDPFHRGHLWQLAEIRRRLGADTAVVTVMSGSFVQRGEPALCGKHARAEMALRGGANLVLELPSPWSCAPAEIFARGGVALLAASGVVTHMAFGCESGDLAPLSQAAACLDSGIYGAGLRRFLDEGMTFAAARQAVVGALAGDAAGACLDRPNNNLAVEYLRSLSALKSGVRLLALPRMGADHHSDGPGPYASASAVRRRILAGEAWRDLVPETTAAILDRELAAGRAPASLTLCGRAVLARLRTMSEEDFRPYDGGGRACTTGSTTACARPAPWRSCWHMSRPGATPWPGCGGCCCTAIWPAAGGAGPDAALSAVLGADSRGRALLREMGDRAALPVLTKPADVRKLGEEARTLFAREAGGRTCTPWPVPNRPGPARNIPTAPSCCNGRGTATDRKERHMRSKRNAFAAFLAVWTLLLSACGQPENSGDPGPVLHGPGLQPYADGGPGGVPGEGRRRGGLLPVPAAQLGGDQPGGAVRGGPGDGPAQRGPVQPADAGGAGRRRRGGQSHGRGRAGPAGRGAGAAHALLRGD